jgi:hypothetical protein
MSVAPSTVASLFEQASALLNIAGDALEETVGGLPDRSYVAPAEPAFDCCPFLTVHVPALGEDTTAVGLGGVAGGRRATTGSVILATYVILAIRCAPQAEASGLPALSDIEAVAREVQQDGWALWNVLRQAIRDGEIFGMCSEVYFDGGVSVPEQGGCIGWRFTVRAAIPGIPPDDPIYMSIGPAGEENL